MSNTMDTIALTIENGSWVAKHTGAHAAEVIDLFGSDTIPTAFTDVAPYNVVVAKIRQLNPTCVVS